MSLKKNRGFTLIELLVVIAIIGLLASVVLASLNSAREKGQDSRRLADMKQLQLALELYYDTNNQYPNPSGGTSWYYSSNNTWSTLATELADYMPSLPVDPVNESGQPRQSPYPTAYSYFVISDGSWYMLVFNLENPDPQLEAQDGCKTYDYGQALVWGGGC